MSYGFIAKNGSDETVFDSEFPSLVKISSGTMSTYAPSQPDPVALTKNAGEAPQPYGTFQNFVPPSFDIGRELLALPLPVGGYVSIWGNSEFNLPLTVTSGSSDYVLVGERSRLPDPTGNGAALFGSNGDPLWSSEVELGYLVDAGSGSINTLEDTLFTVNPDFTHLIINQQLLGRAQVSQSEFAFISFGIGRVSSNTLRTMRLYYLLSTQPGGFDWALSDVSFITAKL